MHHTSVSNLNPRKAASAVTAGLRNTGLRPSIVQHLATTTTILGQNWCDRSIMGQ